MPSVGCEPTVSESERPQTYALDRAANGTCTIATTFAKYLETQTKVTPLFETVIVLF